MKWSLMRHSSTVLLAALLLMGSATAEETSKQSLRLTPEQLQQQFEHQQERLLKLERLVREQGLLLKELRKQLVAQGSEFVAVPSSAAVAASAVRGVTATQEVRQLSGEVETLATTVEETRSEVAKLAEVREKQSEKATLTAGWTGSHAYIKSSDGNFRMQFGGRLQLDWRSYTGTVTPPGSFFIRRARVEAQGELFRHYEYKVQGDFADTTSALLRDAYINVNYLQGVQVKFGQFKPPFSQEELRSSKYIDFVERSSVNNLALTYTPGVMVHGKLADGTVEYALAGVNGQGPLKSNTATTPETFLRLRFTPYKSGGPAVLRGFSFGGAVGHGRKNNGVSVRGRTASRSVTFFDPVPVNGKIVRANAEFRWLYKNFSLAGEYDQTNQFRQGLAAGGGDLPGVVGKGYLLQATYLLTGEKKGEGGIAPASAFLEEQRGRGAWELAFRYENLQVDDRVNPNRAEAFTFGVNWWLTKFVRYQSNFIFEQFKDPARTPDPGDTSHFSYLSRMQVIF